MRSLTFTMISFVLLAGCANGDAGRDGLAPDSDDGGPSNDDAAGPAPSGNTSVSTSQDGVLFRMVRLPEPNQAGEPSIAIAADGTTAYVVAPGTAGSGRANQVWRSDDAGRTWIHLGAVAAEHGTNDATIAVRPDGTVWIGTLWLRDPETGLEGPLCWAVSTSTDKGVTWDTNPMACGTRTFDERGWLSADDARTYLLHPCVALANPCLSTTTDNAVWTNRPMTLPPGGTFSPPSARNGTLRFAFTVLDPGSDAPGYRGPFTAFTNDGGATVEVESVALEPVDARFLQFAWSDAGALTAWVSLRPGGGTSVRAATETNGTWGAPFDVESTGSNGMIWASARGAHRGIAWLHTEEGVHPHEVPANASWRVRTWVDGEVREAPFEVHRGPLCVAYSLSPPCGRSPLGDFISMDIRGDGTPIVAVGVDAGIQAEFNRVPIHVIFEEATG